MASSRSRVFLDVSEETQPIGRLVFELFEDKTPKTCENFRTLCTGSKPPLTYKMSPFHRVIDDFMIQGGDITKGNGTGGDSIYKGEFADENIGWRDIDEEGLLCMANRGKDTNSSQFFITLAPCPHLNAKHTIFGRLVAGNETLDRMSKVKVDKDDKPFAELIVSHCGELEQKKKAQRPEVGEDRVASSTERGRHKRRHDSKSRSRSRSPSPSRGHGRRSASRHRHTDRRHRRDEGVSSDGSRAPTPDVRNRKRSDALPDHNNRGRERNRSRSRSPRQENGGKAEHKHYRKRSPPPSRPRSPNGDAGHRRQRSLPNQYRDWREEERLRQTEWERDGDRWNDDSAGRLGGGGGRLGGSAQSGESGVVFKGRGAMKYKEKRKW